MAIATCLSGQQATAASDAAALFQQACSPCHGMRGGGLEPGHPLAATLDPPPADLTDPLFNSRETRRDWIQVVTEGGGPLGRSTQMPAFGQTLTHGQVAAVVDYAKSLAATEGYPSGETNLIRAIRTTKAFLEDEALVLSRYEAEGSVGTLRNTLYFANRFGRLLQGEMKLVQESRAGAHSLDEVEAGLKVALFPSARRRWLVSGGIEASMPIELGTKAPKALGFLAMARPLGERFDAQTSLKAEAPLRFGDRVGSPARLELSSALHLRPTLRKRGIYPGLEAVLGLPLEGPRRLAVSAVPQVLAKLTRRGHLAIAAGVELPVSGLEYDYRVHAFLLWEFPEGLPWEGW